MELYEDLFRFICIDEENKSTVKICVGNNIITNKEFNTIEEAKNYLDYKPYDVLINLMAATIQASHELNKELNKTKKTNI